MSDAKSTPEQNQAPENDQDQFLADVAEGFVDQDALRKKAAERDQYLDLAQRTRAEFENYQKRNQREREQERQFMVGQFVLDILPVLDNIERATAAATQAGEKGPLVQGVGLVEQQFLDLLKRYEVTRIQAEGKPFDASRHQALVHQPTADKPPNTVIQVVEPGYLHRDRVLRPAKVVVAQEIPQPRQEN